MLLSAINLFNFNYNCAKGKATAAFIPLFGTGAEAKSSTHTIPSGLVFGSQNCYAYAGVSFTFRSPMLIRASVNIAAVLIWKCTDTGSSQNCQVHRRLLYIKYFELEISGKLLGNFDLAAMDPTLSSGARMLYKPAGKSVAVVDGKT